MMNSHRRAQPSDERWNGLTVLACTAAGWSLAQGRQNFYLKHRVRATVYRVGCGTQTDTELAHAFNRRELSDDYLNDLGARLALAYGE